ncbi:hypothetical protein [Cytobacillus oceanisediminis]|uniref:hypothetical protein n=1 Tax=Cytobacillus oceanisediminis TaxID=665099 RepID=UPI0024959DDA|nr:hypothetical protein [Cytobacillus oceanisediminis]
MVVIRVHDNEKERGTRKMVAIEGSRRRKRKKFEENGLHREFMKTKKEEKRGKWSS